MNALAAGSTDLAKVGEAWKHDAALEQSHSVHFAPLFSIILCLGQEIESIHVCERSAIVSTDRSLGANRTRNGPTFYCKSPFEALLALGCP